ncbi:MAG TPA: hypothetical protein VFA81_10155 [Burkholderiales bacterium]|nr:hypothetical protein [Burkholderiales bacterium]
MSDKPKTVAHESTIDQKARVLADAAGLNGEQLTVCCSVDRFFFTSVSASGRTLLSSRQ